MLRKRTLFAIFIALVLVGFASRGPIASTFFEWYLKGYCRNCLGSRLTYANLYRENDQWILDHPVLTTKKKLEEGGYCCQAERAVINVSISWLQRSLSLSVDVENSQVDIGKGGENLAGVFKQSSQTFHMFAVHTKFHVPQGAIFIHDFTEDHLVQVPLFFHINLVCKEKQLGCLEFWLGDKANPNAKFSAVFAENSSHDLQINLELLNTDCSYLEPIFRSFFSPCKVWEIVNGNISGKVIFTLPSVSASHAEGEITLRNLELLHPEMEGKVEISEVALNFKPQEMEQNGLKTIQTIGSFTLHPSKITLKKNEIEPFWTIDDITGSAVFNHEDYANFFLSGTVRNHGKSRKLLVNGQGRFAEEGQTNFAIDMDLKGEGSESHTNFHFSAKEMGDEWCFGEVELSGFGTEELDLMQHLIAKNYPVWEHVHIHQGNIDAAILIYLKGLHLSEVKVERIAAYHLDFSFDLWDLYAGLDSALGSLSFDLLNGDPLATLNADLKINQGKLNLEGRDKASWQLSGIDTDLIIHEGVFKESLLKGTIAGLKAEIGLNGTSAGPLILFNFYGKVRDFAQALPDPIRKGIDKKFIDDDIKISANAKTASQGLLFNGKISIEAKGSSDEDIIFGFTLSRSSQAIWKRWPPDPFAAAYFPNAGFEALQAMTPAIALPLYSAYRHLISHDLGFAGFTLKDGWFRAEKLPLNKYLSPFLFRNDQMQLGGMGEFSGYFDGQKVAVNYNADDMVLENSDFAIEIKSLTDKDHPGGGEIPAVFLFDLDKQRIFNTFFIRNATYFEKNSGLLYTEINAKLFMEDTKAHFEDLTAFCNGLYFAGSADIDWSMPEEGVFAVDLHASEMHGKISQLQHLLSHLNKNLLFLKIPLEGNTALRKKGAHLHFFFQKDGYELESVVEGNVTDGVIAGQNGDLSLQELGLNFDYHHKENTLEFSDILGTLLVGKPNHVEEYILSGDKVRFTDYSRNETEFDVWIGDKTRDIVRLAGKTRSDINENGIPYINFIFNRSLSHFGDVHPSTFRLAFKDWSQLELFELKFDFQLNSLLTDLQRFSRTGLFFLSRGILREINEIDYARGNFKAELNYDSVRSLLNYRVDGDDVTIGSREFGKFLLSGSKKGSLWSIDQMLINDISLAFDVLKEGSLWNINFLGARMGDYLLIGMEGQYSDDDSHLEARINLFEADLARLSGWPLLKSFGNLNSLAGQLRAAGSLNAVFDKRLPLGMHLCLQMHGSLNHAKFKDVLFEDIKNITFRYENSQNFIVSNVKAEIKSLNNANKAGLFLQEASFNLSNRELLVDGLYFDIPSNHLAWIVHCLQDNFPDKISEPVADVIRSAKNYGAFQGSMCLFSSEPYSSLRLHLNDGQYQFMGNAHDLSSLVIDYDPFSLKVFTEYRYKKHRLRLDAHSLAPNFNEGEVVLSDLSQGNIPTRPLKIQWRKEPQTDFYIQKMSGDLSGMNFDLVLDPNMPLSANSMNLIGKIEVNFHKAGQMMEDKIAASIENLEFGNGYSFKGQCSLLKASSQSLADSLFFRGEIFGKDFEFYGCRFENLSAQFVYTPEAAYIRNLAISDPCGSMQVEQIDFFHAGNGFWQTTAPAIALNEFRPSLLRSKILTSVRIPRSLVIRKLLIQDVNGILGDKKSFIGNGQLAFANPPKKNLQASFLAIPVELLTRIGLDLAVLTPVRGMVFFDIADGKANLKRFKDVYSKGRLSKFYLPNNGYGSYVDFEGNLNLQVRMKQYNIIFKLAELFTVNVQGTLKKPTYTLHKQQKHEDIAK